MRCQPESRCLNDPEPLQTGDLITVGMVDGDSPRQSNQMLYSVLQIGKPRICSTKMPDIVDLLMPGQLSH